MNSIPTKSRTQNFSVCGFFLYLRIEIQFMSSGSIYKGRESHRFLLFYYPYGDIFNKKSYLCVNVIMF